MTAPEPTPTAEHIDAVARAVSEREWGACAPGAHPDYSHWTWDGGGRSEMERDDLRGIAKAVLTSTDPAVHAAMLDALVRAGVLTEERETVWKAPCDAVRRYKARHVTKWKAWP